MSTSTTTMRFPRTLCLVALAGLLSGVRCFMSTPDPAKAADRIVRGVLANDKEWGRIIASPLNPEHVDKGGVVLAALGLTPEPGAGITANRVFQHLVSHKSTKGSQYRFGVKVLGAALECQFAKSLLVHTHLLSLYVDHSNKTNPYGVRICMSAIQVSLVHFAGKVAFFGHPLDFFGHLNDEMNAFLGLNKSMLDDKILPLKQNAKALADIHQFLLKLLGIIKDKVIQVSQEYEDLDDDEILELSAVVKLKNIPSGTDVDPIGENMDDLILYNLIREIDIYEHVNVKTVDYDFGENRFKITKYLATTAKDPDE